MHKTLISTVFLTLIASSSFAEDIAPWQEEALKSTTPDELAYYIGVDDECLITESDAASVIEGVMVRSRIRPLMNEIFEDDILYLSIMLACLSTEDNNPAYTLDMYFGRYMPEPPVLYDRDYGSLGIGDADYLLESLKEGVEEAITDYIKVNFDL